jgi:hypothetical protein
MRRIGLHDRFRVRRNWARIGSSSELIDLPLFDEDGTDLWPELTVRLDKAVRRGTLIIMRDHPDRRCKVFLSWNEHYFRHRVAKIREAAGIDPKAKFMGLRHGGNVEGAEVGLTDAQLRALSGHRTTAALLRYAQTTKQQRRTGARMRLEGDYILDKHGSPPRLP